MAYASWSVVFGEQPSAAKWNILGTNDSSFNDGTGFADSSHLPQHLMAGTGSSWAWQSWTPTWTNLTIGNAVVEAKYKQIGKTVTCRVFVTLGTTSSVGSNPTFTLPVTSVSYTGPLHVIGVAYLNAKNGLLTWSSTTTAIPRVWDANNDLGSVTATLPVTWGNGSIMNFTFTYEAA